MAKKLTHKDMVNIIAVRTGHSKTTIERIYNNIIDIIAEELKVNNSVRLKDLGEFYLEQKGGSDEIFLNKFGITEKRYVEPYYVVDLKTNQKLLDYINYRTENFVRPYKKKQVDKSKADAYSDFLDEDDDSTFDDLIFELTEKRRKASDYQARWKKGEQKVDPKNQYHPRKIKIDGVVYDSIKSGCEAVGVDSKKIYDKLRGKTTKRVYEGHEFELLDKD